ncbi:hypothetical protein [Streptomyces sp. DH8]|uniref:hypothetical protein n=1 Tax=Streptomyces sp. DH8 TaxID=2857008 RepID=UPI001E5F3909|nr:hypothetical protein [Streptomyces sp. DH8]
MSAELDYLRTEAARPVCACGDPKCVYVANLATVIEHLESLAPATTQEPPR